MSDRETIELMNFIKQTVDKSTRDLKNDINELRAQTHNRFNHLESTGVVSTDEMDSADVLRSFKISRSTLHRYIKQGLPSYKANGKKHGKLFFKKDEVKRFIKGE